jgi:hypothetical protein
MNQPLSQERVEATGLKILERPLKDEYFGFRIPAAKKRDFEENALMYAEALEEFQGVDDLTAPKIVRQLVEAFNRAMKSGEMPVYPFKLVTISKTKKKK